MLKNLPSIAHSTHVTNEYYLSIDIGLSGCCSKIQAAKVPITILPISFSKTMEAPEGFNPLELGSFSFELGSAGPSRPPLPTTHDDEENILKSKLLDVQAD